MKKCLEMVYVHLEPDLQDKGSYELNKQHQNWSSREKKACRPTGDSGTRRINLYFTGQDNNGKTPLTNYKKRVKGNVT